MPLPLTQHPALIQAFGPPIPAPQWPPLLPGATQLIPAAATLSAEATLTGAQALPVPYDMGSASAASGANTLGVAVTANVQGHGIAVWVTSNSNPPNMTGVSDPVNGAYTAVGTVNSVQGAGGGQWFIMPNALAVTGAQSVTAAFSGSGGVKTIHVVGVPGMASALPIDQFPAAQGTGSSPSATSGLLAQAREIVLAGLNSANTGGTPTWTGSFTIIGSAQHNGTAQYSSVAQGSAGPAAVTATASTTGGAWGVELLCVLTSAVPAVQGAVATLTAVTAAGDPSSVLAPATLTAAALVNAPLTSILAPATLAALTQVTSPDSATLAVATLAAITAATSPAAVLAPASLTAVASLGGPGGTGAPATLLAGATVQGTGGGPAGATLSVAASVSAPATVLAPIILTAAAAVAAGQITERAAAALIAQAAVSAVEQVKAPASLSAAASLAALGSVIAKVVFGTAAVGAGPAPGALPGTGRSATGSPGSAGASALPGTGRTQAATATSGPTATGTPGGLGA